MNAYYAYSKKTIFNKMSLILVAVLCVLVLATCLVTLTPKDAAAEVRIYQNGKKVATLDLSDDYNPVATYSGVRVLTADGAVRVTYREKTVTLEKKGNRLVYPTLGLVVELV